MKMPPARTRRTPRRMQLGRLLRLAREAAGLTQENMAEILQRPQSLVSHYEAGERKLDVIELIDICAVLRLDPRTLVGELMAKNKGKN